jgi:hypothetical protein
MSRTFRQIIIFSAPILVGVANWFHPVHFEKTGVYDAIHPEVGWWIVLHVLNLFGFAFLAWAAYLLIKDEKGIASLVAKAALVIFVPTYIGFDSLIGIGTGTLVQYAQNLIPDQLTTLKLAIDAFWVGAIPTALAIAGSVAWSTSMFAIAVHFAEANRRPVLIVFSLLAGAFIGIGYSMQIFGTLPWWIGVALIGLIAFVLGRPSLPTSMLILSGVLFGTTHVVPFGPLGMACLLVAAIQLEFVANKGQIRKETAITS